MPFLALVTFSGPEIGYFIHKQKAQTDGVKNKTFRSSLHAVKIIHFVTEDGN